MSKRLFGVQAVTPAEAAAAFLVNYCALMDSGEQEFEFPDFRTERLREAIEDRINFDLNHSLDLVFSGEESNFGCLINMHGIPQPLQDLLSIIQIRCTIKVFSLYLATCVREADNNFHLRISLHSVTFGGRVIFDAES